jgi:hypothetical protein
MRAEQPIARGGGRIGAHVGAAPQRQGVLRLDEKLFRHDRRVARNPLRGQGLHLVMLVRPIGSEGDLARVNRVSEDSINARPVKLASSEVFSEVGRNLVKIRALDAKLERGEHRGRRIGHDLERPRPFAVLPLGSEPLAVGRRPLYPFAQ